MSRSIYASIEVRRGSTWYVYSQPNVTMCSEIYDMLTGRVPDGIPAGMMPVIHKGVPGNMSVVAADTFNRAEQDYAPRNVGWMDSGNIKKAQELMYALNPNVKKTGIDVFDFEHSVFRTYINGNAISSHDGWDDSRLIFWTDK